MHKRITKELHQLSANPPEGISCYTKQEGVSNRLSVSINGPCGSPYVGKIFELDVHIPNKYPLEPPVVKFVSRIYHPNIDNNGLICLDLLKMPPEGSWKPTFQLQNVLVAIQTLMLNPNPDDPVMPDIAKEYKFNRQQFEKNAKQLSN